METTIGQLLINDALPEDMRDYSRVVDKKSLTKLMAELATNHPDRYAEINQKFHHIGHDVSTTYGKVASLTLDSFRTPPAVRAIHDEINKAIEVILQSKASQEEKDNQITTLLGNNMKRVADTNYEEGLKENNPLAIQVLSGSRGNANQFMALRGGDMLVVDHKDRPIPIPMMKSFSEGLGPVEYWAGAYGARKGAISTKFATPKSGFLGKQLSMATHRLMITEKDCGTGNGITVNANEPDNEGALLVKDYGAHKAGSVITSKTMKDLGDQKILIRSPLTCRSEYGLCQKCSGIRERGGFPPIGDNVGITAAQAISEPIGQGQLSVKHSGGQASGASKKSLKSGLDLVNQLVQVPKTFQGAAAIANVDGRVHGIEDAPQGGSYVNIGETQHWVPPGEDITVKKGDVVEAGDVLSSGIPNPGEIVRHKGIGEGRRYFVDLFHKTLKENSFPAHRRNVELLARGLINHVRITDPDGPEDTVPDDVVEYDSIVRGYTPRFGFKMVSPKQATGLYLEEPVLHYSIGTKVSPKVAKTLDENKIGMIKAHADEPSFAPEMTRAMETLTHSDDWMVRLGGFNLKKGLTNAVHRSGESHLHGTSFIPPLAQGIEFGKPPDNIGY